MEIWFLIALIMAAASAAIAAGKGRSGLGFFVYGLIFWPAAFLNALLMSRSAGAEAERLEAIAAAEGRLACPFCAEWIRPEATVCPFCQRDLPEGWTAPPAKPEPDPVEILAERKAAADRRWG